MRNASRPSWFGVSFCSEWGHPATLDIHMRRSAAYAVSRAPDIASIRSQSLAMPGKGRSAVALPNAGYLAPSGRASHLQHGEHAMIIPLEEKPSLSNI